MSILLVGLIFCWQQNWGNVSSELDFEQLGYRPYLIWQLLYCLFFFFFKSIWDESLEKNTYVVLIMPANTWSVQVLLTDRCTCFWKKWSLCLPQSCSVLSQLLFLGMILSLAFSYLKEKLSWKSSEDIAFLFFPPSGCIPSDDNVQVYKSKVSLLV